MLVFKKVSDLQKYIAALKTKNLQIGFVPTMGALHSGHKALVELAQKETDLTVVSIFVNPTQFNDVRDLEKYPRTPESDLEILAQVRADIVFMPEVSEIYPQGTTGATVYNFSPLDTVLEGVFRTGHFSGMAQVVSRLLEIVKPHRLFMGQKDFQQAAIVARLLEQLPKLKTQLVVCPTIREADGLAMSSRNTRLTPENRITAAKIYETLQLSAAKIADNIPLSDVKKQCLAALESIEGLKPEYFDIVDGRTLASLKSVNETDYVVALTAVWAGDVRLIDNIIIKKPLSPSSETNEE
jgi:pantoate--beta-alanine ligase